MLFAVIKGLGGVSATHYIIGKISACFDMVKIARCCLRND